MEKAVDNDTECNTEKSSTDHCLLLDKCDDQLINHDNEGDNDEDNDLDDIDKNQLIIAAPVNQQRLDSDYGSSNCALDGDFDNDNGNNISNSDKFEQIKPTKSHNHSENGVTDLIVNTGRFSKLNKNKKFSNNDCPDIRITLNGSSDWSQSLPKYGDRGCVNGNIHNSSNINNNNSISQSNDKIIKRLISCDSGESNKSSKSGNGSGKHRNRGGPPQTPPDGGWGWVVVFASFMISLIADGVAFSYGFLYVALSEHFGESKSKTALVGSILLSMPALTGPIASALTDRYGCRAMTIVSGLLAAFGFILGSFARKLEYLFIAFSITGIGLSLSSVTSIVIVAYYFNAKRSFATGLAVCGTGIGTFLFAPLTTYLLAEYTWRGTLLIMSGFFLNIIVFGALMKDINVSEVESICSQDSDSDSDSVMEPSSFPTRGNSSSTNAPLSGCGGSRGNCFGSYDPKGDSSLMINVNNCLNPSSAVKSTTFLTVTNKSTKNMDSPLYSSTNKCTSPELPSPLSSLSSSNPHRSIANHLSTTLHNEPHNLNCIPEDVPCCKKSFLRQNSTHTQSPFHHRHHFCPIHSLCKPSSSSPVNPKSDLKYYSSLFNIPTYISNDGQVSHDILKEISGRKDGNLNQLIKRYPNLLSFLINNREDKSSMPHSSGLTDELQKQSQGQMNSEESYYSKDYLITHKNLGKGNGGDEKKRRGVSGDLEQGISSLHKRDVLAVSRMRGGLKVPRPSLTYRTALFNNMRRYRFRSSSAPDIYHSSMVTISERPDFLTDIKLVLKDVVDFSIFKNFRFTLFCLSNLLLHGCIDVPYVYLPDHAISSGVCVKEVAFYLISVLGIANTLGTIIVGYIGDKPWLGPSTWYSGLTAIGGISLVLIPSARNYYLLAFLSALYGFSVSANYTLVSIILVEIISLDKFTNAYGLMLLVQGIASMIGPPIAGWLYDISGNYDTTFYVIGLCVFLSGAMVIPLKESPSPPSSSSSSSHGSSMIESTSRPSSPIEDKISALSSNKPLFNKEPMP